MRDLEAAVVDRVHGQADAVDADRTLPCDVPVQRRGRIERPALRTRVVDDAAHAPHPVDVATDQVARSEEHTSELQSLMRISYAVFCWKNKNTASYRTPT